MKDRIGTIEIILGDDELRSLWEQLDEKVQQHFIAVDERREVPNMLGDTMFKGIFDPRWNKENLSRLVSAILGQDVTVLRSLDKEGFRESRHSKGLFLDLLVEFSDGSLANVEIQRRGIDMPPERTVAYSCEMVVNQYAAERGQAKGEIDYSNIHKVYSIIIIEESHEPFKSDSNYCHHFEQKSDTGLDLELVQRYTYVCLDIFRESKPRIADKLTKWLEFLTIRDSTDMMRFIVDNPSFGPIYNRAVDMMADREELLHMLLEMDEDIVASINLTNASRLKKREAELAEAQEKIDTLNSENASLSSENVSLSSENDNLKKLLSMHGIDYSGERI